MSEFINDPTSRFEIHRSVGIDTAGKVLDFARVTAESVIDFTLGAAHVGATMYRIGADVLRLDR